MKNPGILYIAYPYDDGFKIYVDGEPAEKFALVEAIWVFGYMRQSRYRNCIQNTWAYGWRTGFAVWNMHHAVYAEVGQ